VTNQRAMAEYIRLHHRLVGEFGALHDIEKRLAQINAQPNPRAALKHSIGILADTISLIEDGSLVVLPSGKIAHADHAQGAVVQ
jgi:hypothetical protein